MAARRPKPKIARLADEMIDGFCIENDVRRLDLTRPHGPTWLVQLRWQLWADLYEALPISLPNIAWLFNRDHSTVLYGIRRAQQATTEGEVQAARWIKFARRIIAETSQEGFDPARLKAEANALVKDAA